ncbi:MAG: hypothetical protein Q8P39_02420 [Candidatus Yanofskybacteria bacterium]|nr:hypothetical protein [Candidatus Yanofskybacteria bacterium]
MRFILKLALGKFSAVFVVAFLFAIGLFGFPATASAFYQCTEWQYEELDCTGDASQFNYSSPDDESTRDEQGNLECREGTIVFCSSQCPAFNPNAPPSCGSPSAWSNWTRDRNLDETAYRCGNNECGKDGGFVETGPQRYETRSRTVPFATQVTDSNQCPVWTCDSETQTEKQGPFDPLPEEVEKVENGVGAYQKCSIGSNTWSQNQPALECSGSCYPAPVLKPLNHESLSPKNVFEGALNRLKLPLVVGWESVQEILDIEQNPDGSVCEVGSYRYEFPNTAPLVSKTLDANMLQTDPVRDQYQCSLSPNTTQSFRVQACDSADSESCTTWSNLSIAVSSAPELKSPYSPLWEEYDPNWTEEERIQNIVNTETPTTLEWCQANNPAIQGYWINAYISSPNGQSTSPGGFGGRENTLFLDNIQRFKEATLYFWEIAACTNPNNMSTCGVFSHLWNFLPQGETRAAPKINSKYRDGTPVVNYHSRLEWSGQHLFETHYRIELEGPGIGANARYRWINAPTYPLSALWNILRLDATYSWRVASCVGEFVERNPANCNDDKGNPLWSEWGTFQTTGATPTRIEFSPVNDVGHVGTPTTARWYFEQNLGVPGAASYSFKIWNSQGDEIASGTPSNPEFTAEDLLQGETYTFSVATCADTSGRECGTPRQVTFTVTTLSKPIIEKPGKDTTVFIPTLALEWSPVFGANAYEYAVIYTAAASEETNECNAIVGNMVGQRILQTNMDVFSGIRCAGAYTLQVRACTKISCQETGQWEEVSFQAQETPGTAGGLVPCGRSTNNPDTPWDERKACGIEHLFLLIHNLINFALWKVAPILIALASILTGVIWYMGASSGSANPLAETKRIWRAIGVGLLILLFAWTFLNLLLGLLGFQVGIFGNWYEISG